LQTSELMLSTSLRRNRTVSSAARRIVTFSPSIKPSGRNSHFERATTNRHLPKATPYVCAGLLLTTAASSAIEPSSFKAPQQLRHSATGTNKSADNDEMSQKLIPQHPEDVMVIRNVTPNIVILSVPFARGGILKVGGRATIGKSLIS
jgi:hypothetical protein